LLLSLTSDITAGVTFKLKLDALVVGVGVILVTLRGASDCSTVAIVSK